MALVQRRVSLLLRLLACAAASVLLPSLAWPAQPAPGVVVPIAEPDWVAVSPRAVTGDDANFYALNGATLSRISRDGTLLDRDPIPVKGGFKAAAGAGVIVGLAGDGSGMTYTLKAWSTDGEELWSRGGQQNGELFFDGTAFEHVWTNWNEATYVTRFDPSGASVATRRLRTGRGPWLLATARSRRGFVLCWVEENALVAQFVDDDGTVSPVRKLVGRSTEPLAVATSGDDAVVLFSAANGELDAVRFNRERLIGGPAPVAYGVEHGAQDVVWDGRIYRTTWVASDGRIEIRDLAAGLSTASRATFDWQKTSGRPNCSTTASTAANGRVLLTACGVGVVVDSGQPIADASPARPIYTERAFIDDRRVSWTGDRYVVVWAASASSPFFREIHGRFFAIDGSPLTDRFKIASDVPPGAVQVAAVRDGVLVAWDGEWPDVPARARRFDVNGIPIDAAPFEIPSDVHPAVGANGSEFVIASARECVLDLRHLGSRGTHYSMLERPFASPALCTPANGWPPVSLSRPEIGWDGEAYAILHNEVRPTGMEWFTETPFLARVTRAGVLTDRVQIAEEPFGAHGFAVGENGYLTFAGNAPIAVPRDLSAVKPFTEWSAWVEYPEIVWTGSSWLIFDDNTYVLFSRWSHEIGRGSFYEPPRCWEPEPPRARGITGAGNGCGGALLAFTYTPATELLAMVLPCAPPRQRAVGK